MVLCSCDGPAHAYDPSWCTSGPIPRPKGWVDPKQGNTTIIININNSN